MIPSAERRLTTMRNYAHPCRTGVRIWYVPKRPRDPAQLAKLVVDMATGEVPNDKEQVLSAIADEQGEPTGRAKSAKARVASQTPERRSEIARRAAEVRWSASS